MKQSVKLPELPEIFVLDLDMEVCLLLYKICKARLNVGKEGRQMHQGTVLCGMLMSTSVHLYHVVSAIIRRNDVNANLFRQCARENTF